MAAGAFYTASRRKEGPKLTEAGVGMLLNTAGEMPQRQGILTWKCEVKAADREDLMMVGHTRSRQLRDNTKVYPRDMEECCGNTSNAGWRRGVVVLDVCSILIMWATDETRPEHVCCKDRKDLAARA